MKKILSAVLVLAMMISIIMASGSIGVSFDEKIDVDEAFKLAEHVLDIYYRAENLLIQPSLYNYIENDDLLNYIDRKLYISMNRREQAKALGVVYEYVYYEHQLLFYETRGDIIYLKTSSVVTMQEIGIEEQSGYGESASLIIQRINGELKIIEWINSDLTDSLLREGVKDRLISYFQGCNNYIQIENFSNNNATSFVSDIDSSVFEALEETLENQNAFFDDIAEQMMQNEQLSLGEILTSETNETEDSSEGLFAAHSSSNLQQFDRHAMANWAISATRDISCNGVRLGSLPFAGSNARNRYGITSYPRDFEAIGVGDCTNFVSFAMIAGGARMRFGAHGHSNSWYFRSANDRSTTWSSVNFLHTFLTVDNAAGGSIQGRGPVGTSHLGSQHIWHANVVGLGDIIQIRNGSGDTWGHSGLITGINRAHGMQGAITSIHVSCRTRQFAFTDNRNILDTGFADFFNNSTRSDRFRLIALQGFRL